MRVDEQGGERGRARAAARGGEARGKYIHSPRLSAPAGRAARRLREAINRPGRSTPLRQPPRLGVPEPGSAAPALPAAGSRVPPEQSQGTGRSARLAWPRLFQPSPRRAGFIISRNDP